VVGDKRETKELVGGGGYGGVGGAGRSVGLRALL